MQNVRTRILLIATCLFAAVIVTLVGGCGKRTAPPSSASERGSISALMQKAASGDPNAQFDLGRRYDEGREVPKDPAEALRWIRKAAEQGHAMAEYNLGLCFEGGSGVPKDEVEASKWYRKSAEDGYATAQFDLGTHYKRGDGVPKDELEAAKWLRKAAEQGHAKAQYLVGVCYQKGEGIAKDSVEAVKWYTKAAKQGHAAAQFSLGICFGRGEGVPTNVIEALKWYTKAAEQGDSGHQLCLGLYYDNGEKYGFPKDMVEAVKWYRKAAEQGDATAQCQLGKCYASGEGVPKDELEALAWYNIAAVSGSLKAKSSRDTMERQLGPDKTLLAQQRSRELLKLISVKDNPTTPSTSKTESEDTALGDPKATGSGVFISDDGIILTAAHVVKGAYRIRVVTSRGTKAATLLKMDEANDVAILKSEGTFTPSPIVQSGGVRLGQMVFTLGFPNVGLQGFEPKLTKGEISSMGGIQDDPRSWQISVPVQPGNSGGALFDENGNVVGVVVARLSDRAAIKSTGAIPQNINYAVKSAYAMPLLALTNLPPPRKFASPARFEDVVQNARESVVLIMTYMASAADSDADPIYREGKAAYDRGDYESAIKSLRVALERFPGSEDVFYYIGECFMKQNRYAEAVEVYRAATRSTVKSPQGRTMLTNLAVALRLNGQFQEAIEAYEALRSRQTEEERRADDDATWFFMGACYMNLGKDAESEDAFLRSSALKGDWPQTWVYLGAVCSRQGKYDHAIMHYVRALRLNPKDHTAWNAFIDLAITHGPHAVYVKAWNNADANTSDLTSLRERARLEANNTASLLFPQLNNEKSAIRSETQNVYSSLKSKHPELELKYPTTLLNCALMAGERLGLPPEPPGSHLEGKGTLRINNGTGSQASVKVISLTADKLVSRIMLPSGGVQNVESIPDGHYIVLFAMADTVDERTGELKGHERASRFDKAIVFTTGRELRQDTVYDIYTKYSLTLHPVQGGTAKTEVITMKEFNRY